MKKIALMLLTACLVASSYVGITTAQSSSSGAPGLMPRGTAALPGMYFAGDRDTGISSSGPNYFGISVAGGEVLHYNLGTLFVTGDGQLTGEWLAGDGAVGSPGYAFLSSSSTGMFKDAAGATANLVFAANGTEVARFTADDGTISAFDDLTLSTGNALGVITFNTNSVQRAQFEGDGDFAVDTSTLFVDAVNNRVGIGTASPDAGYALSVGGAVKVGTGYGTNSNPANTLTLGGAGTNPTAGSISFGDNTGYRLDIGTNVTGTFTPRVSIFDDGTLLVGTTTDQPEKLYVNGDFEFTGVGQRNGITLNNPRTFTATYDPASLAANTSRCDDVTVTGITTTGGAVTANIGAVDPAAGCVVATVRASASNTVRVCWRNAIDATTACDTASSTWSFTQAQ